MKKILCLSIVLCFILNAFCFTAFAADVFDAGLGRQPEADCPYPAEHIQKKAEGA